MENAAQHLQQLWDHVVERKENVSTPPGGLPNSGLYWEAPLERGRIFTLEVCETKGLKFISEVFERIRFICYTANSKSLNARQTKATTKVYSKTVCSLL